MARPKRAQGPTSEIHLRITDDEKNLIQQQSRVAGLTISEFIRRRALGIRVRQQRDDQLLGTLIRLGALQKHLLMQINGHPHEDELRRELNSTLANMNSAVGVLLKSRRN